MNNGNADGAGTPESGMAESGARLKALFDSAPIGMAFVATDGRTLMVNGYMESMIGYSAAEICATRFQDLIHPADRDSCAAQFRSLAAGETDSCTIEKRLAHKDGSIVRARIGATAIKDISGKTTLMAVMIEDITGRKKTEDELRKLKRAVEQASSIIAITDSTGIVEYANPRFMEVTGYGMDEIAGRNIKLLNSSFHSPDFYSDLWKTIRQGHVWQGEMRNRKKSGEFYWEESAIAPVKDTDGTVTHFIKIGSDITDRKQTERDLLRAKEEAEAASLAKSAFLANMSHELRTPLNAIIGFSQVLQEDYFGPLTERQKQYVDNILASGQHLLALITDILDISKIEAGEMRLDCTRIRIAAVIENSLNIIRHKTANHSVELSFEADEASRCIEIDADELKIRQIMFNILSNAAKFTPDRGFIKVCMETSDNEVRISVKDNGIGIAAENQVRMFEPFYQVRGEHQKRNAGTGLGLSLTKRMVELHGGRIWLESDGEGRGTAFHFTLPAGTAPGAC